MSITRSFYCVNCRVQLWAGQNDYIYTTPEALAALRAFLLGHEGHPLYFGSMDTMDRLSWLFRPSLDQYTWPEVAVHPESKCPHPECVVDIEDLDPDKHEEHVRADGSRFR